VTELDLMWTLVTELPKALPNVRPFRRQVVNVEAKQGFRVRAGVPGQCDLYLLVRGGRIVEVETKARRGVLSGAQKQWRDFCETWQIPHLVLAERADDSPEATVARWIEEIRAVVSGLA
jgi:hypothetical protein